VSFGTGRWCVPGWSSTLQCRDMACAGCVRDALVAGVGTQVVGRWVRYQWLAAEKELRWWCVCSVVGFEVGEGLGAGVRGRSRRDGDGEGTGWGAREGAVKAPASRDRALVQSRGCLLYVQQVRKKLSPPRQTLPLCTR
jgi:hypothetical protein